MPEVSFQYRQRRREEKRLKAKRTSPRRGANTLATDQGLTTIRLVRHFCKPPLLRIISFFTAYDRREFESVSWRRFVCFASCLEGEVKLQLELVLSLGDAGEGGC